MAKYRKAWATVRARLLTIYGDLYDFSLTDESNYMGVQQPIKVICCKHGFFYKDVHHLLRGGGCQQCALERKKFPHKRQRNKIFGRGIFDAEQSSNESDDMRNSYTTWVRMFRRCYSGKFKNYQGCSVCKEWWRFSKFKEWYNEKYVQSYELDKDILIRGNKIYSPNTCCFVPHRINSLLINCKSSRNDTPVGVYRMGNKFKAQLREDKKNVHLGVFDTIGDAFNAYKREKERYIKEVSQEYFDKHLITKDVYEALMKYEVRITD